MYCGLYSMSLNHLTSCSSTVNVYSIEMETIIALLEIVLKGWLIPFAVIVPSTPCIYMHCLIAPCVLCLFLLIVLPYGGKLW